MNIKISELKNLANEIEKELIDFDCSPEISDAVAAHVESTIESYKIMKVDSIDLSTFMAVVLKDFLKQELGE